MRVERGGKLDAVPLIDMMVEYQGWENNPAKVAEYQAWQEGENERNIKREQVAVMWDFELLRLAGWEYVPDMMPKLEKLITDELALRDKYDGSLASERRIQALRHEINAYAKKLEAAVSRQERELARQAVMERIETDVDLIDDVPPSPIEGFTFDLYNQSLVLLVGISTARKSFLTIHTAGQMRAHGGNIVYWMNEGSREAMAVRHAAWRDYYQLSLHAGSMHIITNGQLPLNLTDDSSVTRFIDRVRQYDPDLVVIDALTGSYVGDENDNTDVAIAMESLLRIKDELGVIVLVADNTGKDVSKGARGAQVKFDKSDTVITVKTEQNSKGEDITTATYAKQKNGSAGSSVKFRWEQMAVKQGGRLVPTIVPVEVTSVDWADTILEYVQDNHPVTLTDVVNGTGTTKPTATKWLKDLQRDGHIVRVGREYYPATEVPAGT